MPRGIALLEISIGSAFNRCLIRARIETSRRKNEISADIYRENKTELSRRLQKDLNTQLGGRTLIDIISSFHLALPLKSIGLLYIMCVCNAVHVRVYVCAHV